MLDLSSDDPGALLAAATAHDLATAARELAAWSEDAAHNADRILLSLAVRVLVRRGDREGIGELQRAITQIFQAPKSSASLPESFRNRWQAVSDVLEARRLQLSCAAPDALLTRRHVAEILRAANRHRSGLPQNSIPQHLSAEVTAGRVTQLLNLMESHGLIERQRQGRDNLIQVSEVGKAALAPRPGAESPAAGGQSSRQRASSFLVKQVA